MLGELETPGSNNVWFGVPFEGMYWWLEEDEEYEDSQKRLYRGKHRTKTISFKIIRER